MPLAIKAVRTFLANQNPAKLLPSGETMTERFRVFQRESARAAGRAHLVPSELTFCELQNFVRAFTKTNPW